MVLSFFSGDPRHGDFDHFVAKAIGMLADAHVCFDLATRALLLDADADAIAHDIRHTDKRINQAEQDLRRELMLHVASNGGADIATVLGFTLLVKKIERVGDHAKNILELAEKGVSHAIAAERDALIAERETVSALFNRAAELLAIAEPEPDDIRAYAERVHNVMAICQARIDSYMASDRPGREVVPVATYNGFLRRIAANLLGVVRAWAEP